MEWLIVLRAFLGAALDYSARGGKAGSFEASMNKKIADLCRETEAEIHREEGK